jgi:hypothetical protein
MAPPLNRATDRHPTPPLSPSTSSGSSHASSTPSSSISPPSSLLQRDSANLLTTCPDSLPLEPRDPMSKLVLVANRFDEDAIMLDDWEEVGHKRPEGLDGKQILHIVKSYPISIPFLPPSGYGIDASVVRRKEIAKYRNVRSLLGPREQPRYGRGNTYVIRGSPDPIVLFFFLIRIITTWSKILFTFFFFFTFLCCRS